MVRRELARFNKRGRSEEDAEKTTKITRSARLISTYASRPERKEREKGL